MDSFNWYFPLEVTHAGMTLGNGTTGIMVWGEGETLKVTIGRADLWDHRGGMRWTEKQNYFKIRECLENNDAAGIKNIFATDTEEVDGEPDRPSIIPVGRYEINLGAGAELTTGETFFKEGRLVVNYTQGGVEKNIHITHSMTAQVMSLTFADISGVTVKCVPSWEFVGDYLESISFTKPVAIGDMGWVQALPADPVIAVCAEFAENTLWIANNRSDSEAEIKEILAGCIAAGSSDFSTAVKEWWAGFWKDCATIDIPNERLAFLYNYGMYKFAAFTNPEAVPATLQGGWIEEYRMPPWSSDYHFNINVQMCYWPAYYSGKLENLLPMFEMVWSWRDILQQNARYFVGIDDGYMMPHAVDDHCVCMGSFWTGTIDHACSAWIAIMMHEYVDFTADVEFLRTKAYPFMVGVMKVYAAMLEWDGDKCSMPVSVSPEYNGADMDAWGKDASFQLAATHRLIECLQLSAAKLGLEADPEWQKIEKGLPLFTTFSDKDGERIALWEGQDLEESHRHHSHLGAITPFDSIDPYADEVRDIVSASVFHWTRKGMGHWSGWCMPWASMIHSHLGNGTTAELILEIWQKVFTNKGHGSLHDGDSFGITVMGSPRYGQKVDKEEPKMQMDGGMGAVRAIQEMLLHSRRGIYYIFQGVPESWRHASFANMAAAGTVKVSADYSNDKITGVTLTNTKATTFKLGNPWSGCEVKVTTAAGEKVLSGVVLEIELADNDSATLSRA